MDRNRLLAVIAGLLLSGLTVQILLRFLSDAPTEAREVHFHDSNARGELGPDLLVFVVVDTLRRDHLGLEGYRIPTSPTLDRLGREGLLASSMVTHSSHTVPSMVSILTSTFPFQHGVQFDADTKRFGPDGGSEAPFMEDGLLTLPEFLAQHGYFTAAVVANPWLGKEFGFAQGFARYVQNDCHFLGDWVCDGRWVNDEALAILDAHPDEKLFLYLHYMDVHNPYAHAGKLPRRFRGEAGELVYENGLIDGVSDVDLAYSIASYDEGIAYVDGLIGELSERLANSPRSPYTTLVITSDHGEEFLEHGGLGHGMTLHREVLQTFAILWTPNGARKGRVTGLRGSVDLFPTVVDILGLTPPPGLQGATLLGPVPADRVLFSELAREKTVFQDGWKLTRDLRTGIDSQVHQFPGNMSAAVVEHPSVEVVQALEKQLERLQRETRGSSPASLDEGTASQLRGLGYFDE